MYVNESDLPEWFCHALRDDVELAFDGGKYVGNGHVIIAVGGGSWAFGGLAQRVLDRESTTSLDEDNKIYLRRLRTHDDDLTEAGAYSVVMTNGSPLALRYYGLIDYLYPDAEWFGDNPRDPVIAKLDGQVVALVMPLTT